MLKFSTWNNYMFSLKKNSMFKFSTWNNCRFSKINAALIERFITSNAVV